MGSWREPRPPSIPLEAFTISLDQCPEQSSGIRRGTVHTLEVASKRRTSAYIGSKHESHVRASITDEALGKKENCAYPMTIVHGSVCKQCSSAFCFHSRRTRSWSKTLSRVLIDGAAHKPHQTNEKLDRLLGATHVTCRNRYH